MGRGGARGCRGGRGVLTVMFEKTVPVANIMRRRSAVMMSTDELTAHARKRTKRRKKGMRGRVASHTPPVRALPSRCALHTQRYNTRHVRQAAKSYNKDVSSHIITYFCNILLQHILKSQIYWCHLFEIKFRQI